MAETLYGTVPCPQSLGYTGNVQDLCKLEAQVYQIDNSNSYRSVCPEGHEHSFDERYLVNVTPNSP